MTSYHAVSVVEYLIRPIVRNRSASSCINTGNTSTLAVFLLLISQRVNGRSAEHSNSKTTAPLLLTTIYGKGTIILDTSTTILNHDVILPTEWLYRCLIECLCLALMTQQVMGLKAVYLSDCYKQDTTKLLLQISQEKQHFWWESSTRH